jgi:hypothetical protein
LNYLKKISGYPGKEPASIQVTWSIHSSCNCPIHILFS